MGEAEGAGPLALVGGDELNPGNETQDRVLVAAAGEGPGYVIATAAGRHRPELAVEQARRWFGALGLTVDELPALGPKDVRRPEFVERARSGRFFYLVGGDPGLVPKVLAGSPMWDAIVAAWREGAALGGSSAGAMAMGGWTLTRARIPGDERRHYTNALGLCSRIAVLPHFETFGHTWVKSAVAESPRPDVLLLGLDERTAAVWTEGDWRAMGPGAVTLIANGEPRRFTSGETIDGMPAPG
jgi:cyanophycinase